MATVKILKLDTGGVQFIDQVGDKLAQFTAAASMKLLRKDNKILITDRGSEEHAVDSDVVTTLTVGGVDTPFAGNVQALWDELAADFFFLVDPTAGTSPQLYDAVVDAGGDGDYLLPSEAITAGACSIFVRAGTYNEVDDVVMASNCKIVGETSGAVIVFPAGKGIVASAAGTIKTAGTIAVTNGSATVTGTGTAFAAGDVGNYINIGLDFFKVASFTSATEIEITEPYKGDTVALLPYKLSPMVVGVTVQSLNLQGGGISANLVLFEKVLYSTMKEVFVNAAALNGLGVLDCGAIDIENTVARNSTFAGVTIQNSTGVKISESSFNNNNTQGVFLLNSKGVTVDHCFASNNADNGVEVSGTTDDIVISDLQAWYNNNAGIRIIEGSENITLDSCNFKGNNTGINNSCLYSIISNCFVSDSFTGIACLRESHLTGNFVVNISGIGINLSGVNPQHCTVIGNSLKDCGQGITSQSDDHIITGNTLENCALGIRVIGSDNNVITQNKFLGTGNLVISCEGVCVGNSISGNIGNTIFLQNATDTVVEGVTYNKLRTTDATTTTISTIPLSTDDTIYLYEVIATAMATDQAEYGTWKRFLAVKQISGTTTIDLFDAVHDSQTGLIASDFSAVVSGTDIGIQVTGNVGDTIDWIAGHKLSSQTPNFLL